MTVKTNSGATYDDLVKIPDNYVAVRAEPFEAIELDLLLLWGEPRAR